MRRLYNDPGYRKKLIGGFSECNRLVIRQKRIYCLTPKPTSNLMWSHYANNHRGICLEFHTGNPLFSGAKEVVYRPDYPRWLPHEVDKTGVEMFLCKSDDWKYEEEFRIIGGLDMEKEYLNLDGEYFYLPPGALQSVIVGCEADEADYDAVRKMVSDHSPDVSVRRVVRMHIEFRLQIVP